MEDFYYKIDPKKYSLFNPNDKFKMIDDYHCDVLVPNIGALHKAESKSQKTLIDFQQTL